MSEAKRRLALKVLSAPKVGKLKRDVFLYMAPKGEAEEKDFAHCGSCVLFTGATCFWFTKDFDVEADDSCALYVHGAPRLRLRGKEINACSPQEAGFVHHKVQCQRCIHFSGKEHGVCGFFETMNKESPALFDLDTSVYHAACCNAHQPKKKE